LRGLLAPSGDGLDKAVRTAQVRGQALPERGSERPGACVRDRVSACVRACVRVRVRLSLLVHGAVGGGVELCSFPVQAVPAMGLTLGMMIGPVALPAIYNAFADRC
jgi:hypothetical protein